MVPLTPKELEEVEENEAGFNGTNETNETNETGGGPETEAAKKAREEKVAKKMGTGTGWLIGNGDRFLIL